MTRLPSPGLPRLLGCALGLLPWLARTASGAEVFLTALTIYNKHDILNTPEIYFTCQGDGQEHMLNAVKAEDKLYVWEPGSNLLLDLGASTCRTCGFYEKDHLPGDADDVLGEFDLCLKDFQQGSLPGQFQLLVNGEFLAVFRCPSCVAPPPPPPPPPAPPAPPSAAHPAVEVVPARLWRFMSSSWTIGGDTQWEVILARAYPTTDCTGEPLMVSDISFRQCCGAGPWPTVVDSSSETTGELPQDDDGADSAESAAHSSEAEWVWWALEDWGSPGPSTGPVDYDIQDNVSCKDYTHMYIAMTNMVACQDRCSSWETCHAYTFNRALNKCFLKETCLDPRVDNAKHDISGFKMTDSKAFLSSNASDAAGVVAATNATLSAIAPWALATHSVTDSASGGASVTFELPSPETVQCVLLATSLNNPSRSPTAGTIEFSTDEGDSWSISQIIGSVAQEGKAVKILSQWVDVGQLAQPGVDDAAAPPGESQAALAPSPGSGAGTIVLSVALVFVALGCFVAGFFAWARYSRHMEDKRQQYEQRFESVFDSPDFEELDRIVESDRQGFLSTLSEWAARIRPAAYQAFGNHRP